jgi:hypothetical protein
MRVDLSEAISILKRRKEKDAAQIELLERLRTELRAVTLELSSTVELSDSALVGMARKRGRKRMAPEEREVVSVRMRKYWEGRRQGKAEGAS